MGGIEAMAPLRFVFQISAICHAVEPPRCRQVESTLHARSLSWRGHQQAGAARRGKQVKKIPGEYALRKIAWSHPLPSDVRGRGALHRALVSGAASALLVGLGVSADAAPRGGFFSPYGWYGYYSYPAQVPSRRLRAAPARRERAEPKKEIGFGEMPKGPLQIVVSIDHQRVTLFSNGVRVAQGPVSTGVPGHPTPMGVFSIIEKDRYHHSNLYSNAPMPFMQRITWSGVALHEGVLPGYPASHGCIRTSHDFAQKLWPITKLGVRFIVSRDEVVPVDFEHPKLFVPKQKPAEPGIVLNAPQGPAAPIKLAEGPIQSQTDAASPASAAAETNDEPLPTGSTETGAAAALPAGVPAELRKSV